MSGGQRYLNMNSSVGQTRITPVGGMANRVISQPAQQFHPMTTTAHHQQPHSRIAMSSHQTSGVASAAHIAVQQYNSNKSFGKRAINLVQSSVSYNNSKVAATQKGGKGMSAAGSSSLMAASGSSKGAGGAGSRRKVVKVNKGLRHFSMKVCEKVKEKGTTTYNEVADELVEDEMRRVEASGDRSFDQKNIRRRVYDALNVLMAMNIIAKEKKEIRWLGLPINTPAQCATLDEEISVKRTAIEQKEKELKDLLLLQVSLKNLVNRNRESEEQGYIPTPNSHIQLPFIVVNTHRDTRIHCTISQDKTEYFFKFDDKFELNDHVTVLQRMGLLMGLDTGTSTPAEIAKLKQLVPLEFQGLIEDYGTGKSSVDMPDDASQDLLQDVLEEDDESMIEYVDGDEVAEITEDGGGGTHHHQHYVEEEEEYSEEDTIIEEGY